jgi:outer membrane lipoprotein-sorting protein
MSRRSLAPAFGLLFLSLLGGRAAQAEPAGPLTLDILMHHMATTRGVRARFHEVKEVSLLAAPVESRGTVYFVPPDRFARHTTAPGRSWLVIEGDRLRFADEVAREEIDLSGDPVAGQFVGHFVVLWNGDLEALRERYEVAFEAGAGDGGWTLTLIPRSSRLRSFIEQIEVRGEGPALHEMTLVEADGDRTLTSFDDVETDHVFGAQELAEAFPRAGARGMPRGSEPREP